MNLRPIDVSWVINNLPKAIVKLMVEHHAVLAGGFIRAKIANEVPNDIDLMAENKDHAKFLAHSLVARVTDVFETDNAYTVREGFKTPIQIIHRWTFRDPLTVVPSFDFTIAKAAIWYGGLDSNRHPAWNSHCHEDYYADLAAKRLVYTFPVREEEAGGSLLRLIKFTKKGYHAPLSTIAGVIARLQKGVVPQNIPPFDHPDYEQALAKVLSGLLREVDPNTNDEGFPI